MRDRDKVVNQGQTLVFVARGNGQLVAPWRDELVMMDTIRMIPGIQPGTAMEVEVLEVEVGNGTILTARPTEATQRALQAAGKWPVGPMVLELCFRAKNGGGVYAIEPATGKRVYPAEGCRVWVNAPCDYLCVEQGRVIVARPVKEPTGRKERDPKDPDSPYTYQEVSRQQGRRPAGRGGQRRDNRDRGGRLDRRPQPKAPATVVVTFQHNEVPGKDGVVAFDEENFGKRPIFARRGATVPIAKAIEVRVQVHGGIVLAEPVKSAEDFRAELGAEVELYTVPMPAERSADNRPAQPKHSESPTSVEKFRQRHGNAADAEALLTTPVAPQAPEKKGQPAPHQPLTFAEQLAAATGRTGQSSKGE